MGNREKWALGMAFLGGIAASTGEVVHPIDTLLGALILGGITFGIASITGSLQTKPTASGSTANGHQGVTGVTGVTANYSDANVSDDMKEFLQTLEIVKGRHDGWYKDPSNLYKLRYFHQGKWTLAVSDGDSAQEKSEALSKHLAPSAQVDALAPPAELSRDTAPRFNPVSPKSVPSEMNQKIEQLERLGTLRKNDMISESEHERLKSEILGNI
jgi:hypothetical protein